MAGIAGTCSSGVLFRSRDSGGNGFSLGQHIGLRAGDSIQTASTKPRSSRFVCTPGNKLPIILHCF